MGATDLSVQVRNISPKTTEQELIVFFQYCGTVERIQLQRDADQSQSAVVTFKKPYAVRTALLLNGAAVGDQRISVAPVKIEKIVPMPCAPKNKDLEPKAAAGLVPAASNAAKTAATTGQKALTKTKEQATEAGKILTHQTKTALTSAEHTVQSIGSTSSSYIFKGAMWLSDVLDKTSKSVVQLGNAYAKNPNSAKQNAKVENSNQAKQNVKPENPNLVKQKQ